MITTPYNFVPLSDKVVTPYWAEFVSHDLPFHNSHSGSFKIKIKAESPIYVRNGFAKDGSVREKESFNEHSGKYFIPGSSVKGMIRSVLEIMSFGKMSTKINDDKYSVRDFSNKAIYPKEEFSKTVNCGWLRKESDKYMLTECGKLGRIDQKNFPAMVSFFNDTNLFEKDLNPTGFNKNIDEHKSTRFKYKEFSTALTITDFDFETIDNDREIYKIGSKKKGKIVFTGQPGCNFKDGMAAESIGKHYEFIFFEPTSSPKVVEASIIKNFKFAYFDHDLTNQKPDWKWRSKQLEEGESIPVFFRRDDSGNLIDMGLSYLYKITYKHSIKEAILKTQKNNNDRYDLSEVIFGYVDGKKALKGRVQMGHAFAINNVRELGLKIEVLGGPKASYYPTYIEQEVDERGIVKRYSTFMDEVPPTIKGWKRYPVRGDSSTVSQSGNPSVSTKFKPLDKGAEFMCDVVYHNLRKEELGALLSAISFHNTEGLFHSIGMAKPLGYGKVSVSIDGFDESLKTACLKAFEAFMDTKLGNSSSLWFQSPQIIELFTMASGTSSFDENEYLKYMKIAQFVNAKGGRGNKTFGLRQFSAISKKLVTAKNLISESEFNEARRKYTEEVQYFKNGNDLEAQRKEIIQRVNAELTEKFEAKRSLLLDLVKAKKFEQKELEEKTKRQKEKEEKQKSAMALGIDFSSVDFGKSLGKIEDEVTKIILAYAMKVHSTNRNGLERINSSYVTMETEIIKVKEAIRKIYNKLPKSEKKSKQMGYRIRTWTKWIGEERLKEIF